MLDVFLEFLGWECLLDLGQFFMPSSDESLYGRIVVCRDVQVHFDAGFFLGDVLQLLS